MSEELGSHDGAAAPYETGLDLDADGRAQAWRTLERIVEEQLASASNREAGPGEATPAEIRERLKRYGFGTPGELGQVLDDVTAMLRDWTLPTSSPTYFGLFNPAPAFAGVVGEALAAAVNPQLAVWSHAPAAVEIERHLLRFMGEALGLPPGEIAGSFTSGGAEANHTAVLLAMTRAFPAYPDHGIRALPGQPVMYASEDSHLAWLKIAHSCGLGREAVRLVPVTPALTMDTAALRAAIDGDRAAGRVPFLVVATAGTTGTGAVDPLPDIAAVCADRGLHLHVDAAWAGAVALSPRLAPLLAGIERADSVTVDAHKWFSVPMGAGMFLCRHRAELHGTFRVDTAYMPAATDLAEDPYTYSLQWSRRFTGLKLFLTLAVLGRDGYARQFEHDVRLGARLRRGLTRDGWQIVNATELPVVCFRPPAEAAGSPVSEIAARLTAGGRAWISTTRVLGEPALRACITNHRTTPSDIDTLLHELRSALHP
ncbi:MULTISPECIES: pyridoxal phosphate-dependent decarboxylase family protein [Streptomyces]|uniref:Pyridoxal-dependent decarboxylase n=1 Tax=Streptomyces tsukubensis (strain DSM 42081 / NBRC 108919 / NRRL 18488 / 9993) TaxID=1114943 RepID=I2N923_STRT9|nr:MULTISPECIES: pyridoxal-dependent decarboxylase [Streptomyces]AZK97394.1 hypothetical protein B7R87_28550 [Streptomyces tsukubensis]EIF93520.1 hypothetical protein [Streptomyces tsukubensis NRRL18488]MYS65218.1 pyridoxal-dependent decarboxylase [Streptomyces sp. SID5473]QKM66650.1 pyridoxal-dependent decarboxylase [Streptomyces tsukubensis NRRL18488]TAI45004.1 pyridoxal-dependent decarboxylase [Streptomyces tsukubensis]